VSEKKKCLIIMPMTTPENMEEIYRDGKDHFKHILECLHIKAVEAAGFEPIPPEAKGSDIVHENIIRNIEEADIVLCDMSCLNANVFFEFGIRTALNKPICLIHDEYTTNIPFDAGIINKKEYRSGIEVWHLEEDVKKIAEHLKETDKRSKNENSLWRVFGLSKKAEPHSGEIGTEEKLDFLVTQIRALRRETAEKKPRPLVREEDIIRGRTLRDLENDIRHSDDSKLVNDMRIRRRKEQESLARRDPRPELIAILDELKPAEIEINYIQFKSTKEGDIVLVSHTGNWEELKNGTQIRGHIIKQFTALRPHIRIIFEEEP